MKLFAALCLLLGVYSSQSFAAEAEKALTPKNEYEREISAVVRNKTYFRAGSFEIGVNGGLLPYESVVKTYMVGGRASYHFTDSIGWEIGDFQYHFPSVGSFLINTLQSEAADHIGDGSNYGLDNAHPLMVGSSNLIITPFYGKIRLAGSWVVTFDFYAVAGVAFGQTRTVNYKSTGATTMPSETITLTKWNPGFNLGVGFRFYFNRSLALTFDLRNATVRARTYNKDHFRSFFSTTVGLTLFLPATG